MGSCKKPSKSAPARTPNRICPLLPFARRVSHQSPARTRSEGTRRRRRNTQRSHSGMQAWRPLTRKPTTPAFTSGIGRLAGTPNNTRDDTPNSTANDTLTDTQLDTSTDTLIDTKAGVSSKTRTASPARWQAHDSPLPHRCAPCFRCAAETLSSVLAAARNRFGSGHHALRDNCPPPEVREFFSRMNKAFVSRLDNRLPAQGPAAFERHRVVPPSPRDDTGSTPGFDPEGAHVASRRVFLVTHQSATHLKIRRVRHACSCSTPLRCGPFREQMPVLSARGVAARKLLRYMLQTNDASPHLQPCIHLGPTSL